MSWAVSADWSSELKLHWSLSSTTHYQDDLDLATKYRGNQLGYNCLRLKWHRSEVWGERRNIEQAWWKLTSFSVHNTGTVWVSSQVLSPFNAALILFKSLLCEKTSMSLTSDIRTFFDGLQQQPGRYWCLGKTRHTSSGQSSLAPACQLSPPHSHRISNQSSPESHLSCQWTLWPQSHLTEPAEDELQQPDWQSSFVPVVQQHTQAHGQSTFKLQTIKPFLASQLMALACATAAVMQHLLLRSWRCWDFRREADGGKEERSWNPWKLLHSGKGILQVYYFGMDFTSVGFGCFSSDDGGIADHISDLVWPLCTFLQSLYLWCHGTTSFKTSCLQDTRKPDAVLVVCFFCL